MSTSDDIVVSDPNIMGGAPVFARTRVPLQALIDYLEAGDSLSQFLEDFPTVTRDQAAAAVRLAGQMLEAHAHTLR
jgi:uncharacterized protein (DUF433 family)